MSEIALGRRPKPRALSEPSPFLNPPHGPGLLRSVFRIDPVLRKELSVQSRRWPLYVARVTYVVLIGLLVYQSWRTLTRIGGSPSISDYAHLSRSLYDQFVPLQLVFAALLSMVAASEMVIREIRSGTLGLLALTGLSVLDIVVAKWKAAVFQAGSLVLSGLPVLAICFYLGGVDSHELLGSTLLTLCLAALGAASAVRFTAEHQTMVLSLTYAGASLLGPGIMAALLGCIPGRVGWVGMAALTLVLLRSWLRNGARQLATCVENFRPLAVYVNESDTLDRGRSRARLPGVNVLPDRGKVPEKDPVFWKELSTRATLRTAPQTRSAVAALLFLLVVLLWLRNLGKDLGALFFLQGIFLMLAIAAGASLFATEREGKRLDLLRATPLSAWDIVRGKIWAGLWAVESLLALGLSVACLLGWSLSSGAGLAGYLGIPALFLIYLIFAYMLGAALSLGSPTMRRAFLLALAIVMVPMAVLPTVGAALEPLGERATALEIAVHFLALALSPVCLAERLSRGPLRMDLFPGLLPLLAVYGLAYGTAIPFLSWATSSKLARGPKGP